MTDYPFSQMVWLHIIVALPATLAAVAALIKARHVKRDTQQIVIAINGQRELLLAELAAVKGELAQRRSGDHL